MMSVQEKMIIEQFRETVRQKIIDNVCLEEKTVEQCRIYMALNHLKSAEELYRQCPIKLECVEEIKRTAKRDMEEAIAVLQGKQDIFVINAYS